MTAKAFRFAAQGTPQDGTQWLATARRAEELGYATLLMPDGLPLRPILRGSLRREPEGLGGHTAQANACG